MRASDIVALTLRVFRAVLVFLRKSNSTPPWLMEAQKEVGFHERGENLGIEGYIKDAKCGALGGPWCAIFVNAMLERSGYPGTRSAMARSFEHNPNFVKLAGPALGAITTMWRETEHSGLGHVFFYLGTNYHDKHVLALGGNQNDQVCRELEPASRIVGYYWPRSARLPPIAAINITTTTEQLVHKES